MESSPGTKTHLGRSFSYQILSPLVFIFSLLQFSAYATISEAVQQELLAECKKVHFFNKEPRLVDEFIANLLLHAPLIDQSHSETFENLVAQQPDFVGNTNSGDDLYSNVELIGAGGQAFVFGANLKYDRPNLGLKAGDRIALRPNTLSVEAEEWENSRTYYKKTLDRAAEVMIRTHQLAVGTENQKPVSEFFPRIYGIYFSRRVPAEKVKINPKSPNWIKKLFANNFDDVPYFYNINKIQQQVEMELVDADMEDYFENNRSIPDSIIFETSIGIWAGVSLAGVQVLDAKRRNFGVKGVNYYRAYHIGKEVLLFEPGIIPKRLDLNDCRLLLSSEERVLSRHDGLIFNPDTYGISEEARDFLREHNRSDPDFVFFKRLLNYFSKYIVTENSLKAIPNNLVKHFHIPDNFLNAE